MSAFLSAKGLRKSFGGVHAVQNVSIDVPQGATFAVIGPNGAGKSTLLNLLSGIYQPDAGSLHLEGQSLLQLPSHKRVRLGVARTFQKIRLFRQLSVLENVLAGFHIRHDTPFWKYAVQGGSARFRDEAQQLLAFVGLAAHASQRAGALSYGQQRMLEVARSLATKPRLFMLDEPAAGLNTAEVEFLLQRLEQIGRDGVTLIVVEHNMDLVMNVAQRVFVMDYGQPLFEGTPREVQSNPRVIEAYLGGEFA